MVIITVTLTPRGSRGTAYIPAGWFPKGLAIAARRRKSLMSRKPKIWGHAPFVEF